MNPLDKTHPPIASEFQPTPASPSDRRAAPEEAVTVIADFRAESDVAPATREEEHTPVVTSKIVKPKVLPRLTGPRMFALGLALVACGFAGFRALSRASFTRTAAASAGAERAQSLAADAQAEEVEEPTPAREATPAQAARSFSLGEHERALAQYRYLAQKHPEVGAYAVMVKVLSAERREH